MTDSCPEKVHCCIYLVAGVWQLIVRSRGILILHFYETIPLTRLCNNLPSWLQLLLNLFSNPLSLLMWYLLISVRSLLISQRNLPNRLSKCNEFSSTFYGLAVSTTFEFTAILAIHTAFSEIFQIFWCRLSSSVFFTTVFAAFWSAITSFLEFFCTVQAYYRFSSFATSSVVFLAVLTIYTTILKWPWFSVTIRLFSFLCATRNPACYRFLFAPFIGLDSYYTEIFRPLASRSRFSWISSVNCL